MYQFGNADENGQRQPDPHDLTEQGTQAPATEDGQADRRHPHRPPGKEVTAVVERGEEGDAQAAVRQGIKQAVDDHDHPGEARQQPPRYAKIPRAEGAHQRAQERGTAERMRKAAMAEPRTVGDAETERQHIECVDPVQNGDTPVLLRLRAAGGHLPVAHGLEVHVRRRVDYPAPVNRELELTL